jgi:hypothetical protein
MFSLEGVSEDVAQFTKGCERLLSALAQQNKFSDTERAMISHYWKEVTAQIQALRDERDERGATQELQTPGERTETLRQG